jgi:hypothetical protein
MTPADQKLFDQLSEAKFRKPFVPFVIMLRDGRQFEIIDRWHVGFARGNPRIVVLPRGGISRFFDWDEVTAIQALESAN